MRFLLILIFSGILFIDAVAKEHSTGNFNVKQVDVKIEMKDGIKLDGSIFKPEGETPSDGWPVIIYCHGYGKSKDDMKPLAAGQATFGYITFTFSMRGQGQSEGKSNFISRLEMEDFKQVVDFLKKRKDIDKNNIAVSGSSQGGIIPFMAACNGLNVRCIISDLGSPEFATSWIQNGSVRLSLLWSLSYNENTVRYNDNVKEYRKVIIEAKPEAMRDFIKDFPKDRDFISEVKNNKVPILFSNSWQDIFFNANGIINSLDSYNKYCKFYMGAIRGHSSDTNLSETEYHNEMMSKWLRYWIFNENNGIADTPRFTYALGGYPIFENNWTFYRFSQNQKPFTGNKKIKFFLWKDKLELYDYWERDSIALFNEVEEGLSMEESVNSEFTGDNFKSKFKKQQIILDSDTLTFNYNILGIPKLFLNHKSNNVAYQVNIQIWEVNQFDDVRFVSSINFTNWENENNEIMQKVIQGNAMGHTFRKGSRIRLVITNLDTREGSMELRTNPYVLPVFERNLSKIYIGEKDGSYIEFPIKE